MLLASASPTLAAPIVAPGALQRFRYAGRNIGSTLALPELPRPPAGHCETQLDIVQQMQPLPAPGGRIDARHLWTDPDGQPAIHGERWEDGRYCLRFPGIADAALDSDGRTITVWQHPDASPESVRHILLDQVLPRAIAQQGTLVLHGSAVATADGRTLVLIGDSGRGKSTLATAFDLYGGMALTDDCVVLQLDNHHVQATPSYSGLRLWPDSMGALLEHRRADAAPMAHYSSKQRIPSAVLTDRDTTRTIDAIFVLQPPGQGRELAIRPKSSRQACMTLLTNAFQLDPADLQHVHRLLGVAARVTHLVPVHALHHPRDYAALPEVVAHISQYVHNASTA